MSRPTLHDLGNKYKADKANKWHEYTLRYPLYLEPFRDKPLRLIELGTYYGASCNMWDEYFTHPGAKLFGYDHLEDRLTPPQKARWTMLQGNQWDSEGLKEIAEQHGPWDVVLDDCAHAPEPQILTFEAFWPHMNSGGVYIIEDINFSSYNETWYNKRVQRGPTSVMPFLNEKLDELLVADSYGKGYWEKGAHTTDMAYIHFYKHVAIIGKK